MLNSFYSSGSCISYLAFNQTEWFNSAVNKYTNVKIPNRQQLQAIIPTGLFPFFLKWRNDGTTFCEDRWFKS